METQYEDHELRQIEHELQTEILPGTEIMADVGNHHFVKSGSNASQVLIPQPSDDPHDPLNWSSTWKSITIGVSALTTFCQLFGPISLAPTTQMYTDAFDCSLDDVLQFTAIVVLMLGFSNFIWVPISTAFGRRPVYLISTALCFGSLIWRAKAQTYSSFMGASILNGIVIGPTETIQLAVIADIFFLHDRGKWNTLYWVTFTGSVMIGPIVNGSMAQRVGWRSFWWLNVAMVGFNFVMLVFLFPETKYHRGHIDEQKPGPAAVPYNEKGGDGEIEAIDSPRKGSGSDLGHTNTVDTKASSPDLESRPTAQRESCLGRGSPSKSQWRIYQTNPRPWHSLLLAFWIPWTLFAFPVIEFASFVVSFSLSGFLVIILTQSQAFTGPPYNFSSENIGFTNFAVIVGAMIGLFTGGPLSDWVSARATRKNRGIREPEMRLPAMIPYVLIMILGCVILSVGYQDHWAWPIVVCIGFVLTGIQIAAIPAIATTYAVDSYKSVAGSLFVSMTVNKNLWAYGLSKFLVPWIEKDGYIAPIMTNCALITIFCSFGILFYYKGKTFRRWSKDSRVHWIGRDM